MKKFIDISDRRGRVEILLDKEGQEFEIFGSFHTKEHEHIDLSVVVVHKAPHTSANITLKGVCEDSSVLNLSGTIVVRKEAVGTTSFLKENILMLSEKASATATPNLEINTDEVKCSHAATISQIPEEHLFYLMSRGIKREDAKTLIVEGFLQK